MTEARVFKSQVLGKVNQWNIIKEQFTIGTPVGDILIDTEHCTEGFKNDLIDAMQNRRTIIIEVSL